MKKLDFVVTKRNGTFQKYNKKKLLKRIQSQCKGFENTYVSAENLTERIERGLYDKVPTKLIEELSAQTAAYLALKHPNYSRIAGRLIISALHKTTQPTFYKAYAQLKKSQTLISKNVFDFIEKHKDTLNGWIKHERDYNYNYFGIMTLLKSYLIRMKTKEIIERPQYMWLRVSIGIHGEDLEAIKETYDLMSLGMFTHASPTLFNSGTVRPQMSSCFLVAMKDDSIEGIYDTLKTCALISKSAGGIGISVSNIRAKGSHIRKTNGISNGLVPMLKVFNDTAKYVDQGGGKRKGAFAIYLEPWHADICDFLAMKKNHGKEEMRARDLFYALWIPDLFMKRVKSNSSWSLFCPDQSPGLNETYGEEFEKLYVKYEKEGKAVRTIKAQQLWFDILDSQTETGGPFMMYKDACNRKSNQKNLGVIKSSNLCTEIVQYSSEDEVAVCNLASMALPRFIKTNEKTKKLEYDFQKLYKIVKIVVKNLNKVIDKNYYPVPEAKTSNMRHRPVGLGVQGLADVFATLRYPWESPEARKLNKEIFETIYFAALTSSCEIAKVEGPYPSFKGSPVSKGILQYHMWNDVTPSKRWDWEALIKNIKQYGVRNSLLCSPMPTASTSQILGNNECIEPFTCNIYARRVLSGEFPIINKYLVNDLEKLDLWSEEMCKQIVVNGGSIQHIKSIPNELKLLYKNVWEISQKVLITLAAERAPYIDQSQSLNIFMANPTTAKMSSMHFYGWSMGLKTGMYYLRSTPAVNPIQFTIDPTKYKKSVKGENVPPGLEKKLVKKMKKTKKNSFTCKDEEGCLMCGS